MSAAPPPPCARPTAARRALTGRKTLSPTLIAAQGGAIYVSDGSRNP
jgi:hypothetical protein